MRSRVRRRSASPATSTACELEFAGTHSGPADSKSAGLFLWPCDLPDFVICVTVSSVTPISSEDSTHEAIGQVRRLRVDRWCDCLHRSAGAARTSAGDVAECVVE